MREPVMSERARRADQGFTLIEVMITTGLLMAVLAIVLPLVAGSLNIFSETQVRSDAVDNAQVALTQIGHDVVSSNLLYIDTSGPAPVVHLQAFRSGTASTCVEYQVQYPAAGQPQVGVMQRRTKAPGAAWAAGWSTVMTGIVNSSQTASPDVFSLPSSSQYQSVVVDLWVQLDPRSANQAAPENYTSTFTGSAVPAKATGFAPSVSEPC